MAIMNLNMNAFFWLLKSEGLIKFRKLLISSVLIIKIITYFRAIVRVIAKNNYVIKKAMPLLDVEL